MRAGLVGKCHELLVSVHVQVAFLLVQWPADLLQRNQSSYPLPHSSLLNPPFFFLTGLSGGLFNAPLEDVVLSLVALPSRFPFSALLSCLLRDALLPFFDLLPPRPSTLF